MINYSHTPEEISEEIERFYDRFVAYDENIEVKKYELWHKRARELAIREVNNLLRVCQDSYIIQMPSGLYEEHENEDKTKLKSVLEILNSKLK